MYFTGLDPLTMEPVPVVRDLREKKLMKALLYWWDPAQQPLAREALRNAGRQDLIGNGRGCLVPHSGRAPEPERSSRPSPARRVPKAGRQRKRHFT
jgi:hypothetical protein